MCNQIILIIDIKVVIFTNIYRAKIYYLEDTFHLIIGRQYSYHDSSALLDANRGETLCFPTKQ